MKKQYTLAIIYKNERVLLGMKKKGFGVGRWNGFGGKVNEGESIEEAAWRELNEESGLNALEIEKIGYMEFAFENDPKILCTHVYIVREFKGKPMETEEMSPKWFEPAGMPFQDMWPDDRHWMPYLLEGKKFKGNFLFDRPSDAEYTSKILSMDLQEVKELLN